MTCLDFNMKTLIAAYSGVLRGELRAASVLPLRDLGFRRGVVRAGRSAGGLGAGVKLRGFQERM